MKGAIIMTDMMNNLDLEILVKQEVFPYEVSYSSECDVKVSLIGYFPSVRKARQEMYRQVKLTESESGDKGQWDSTREWQNSTVKFRIVSLRAGETLAFGHYGHTE